MSIAERKLRHKEEVRSLILDTAWEMVVTEGWQSFSLRKVADAIEYSVTVIYHHFENKDAILLEFIERGFRLLAEQLKKASIGQKTPAGEINAMAHAYRNFAFENQQYYQLMFGLGIPTCETVSAIAERSGFRQVITTTISALTPTISALTPAGKETHVDPSLKYQAFWSMMHGLVSINMLAKSSIQFGDPAEDVLNDLIQSFIKGL